MFSFGVQFKEKCWTSKISYKIFLLDMQRRYFLELGTIRAVKQYIIHYSHKSSRPSVQFSIKVSLNLLDTSKMVFVFNREIFIAVVTIATVFAGKCHSISNLQPAGELKIGNFLYINNIKKLTFSYFIF